MKRYELKTPYSEADVGKVSGIAGKEVLSVTARSAITNFDVRYAAVFRDKNDRQKRNIVYGELIY